MQFNRRSADSHAIPPTVGDDSTTLVMTVSIIWKQVYESAVTEILDTIASNEPCELFRRYCDDGYRLDCW